MSVRPVLVVPFGSLSPGERADLMRRCRNARPVLLDELFSGGAEGDWEAGLRLVAGVVTVPVTTSGGRLFVAKRQLVLAGRLGRGRAPDPRCRAPVPPWPPARPDDRLHLGNPYGS